MRNQFDKLHAIIEASKKLTAILNIDDLLKAILEVAVKEIEAERGTVFIVREGKDEIYSRFLRGGQVEEIVLEFGQGIAGIVAQQGTIITIEDAYEDPRFNRETDLKTGFRTRNILCLPIKKGEKNLGVIQLLNSINPSFTDEDAEFLSALASHMAIAIENAIALKKEVEQERTRKEVELAAKIQCSLLPKKNPQDPRFELDCIYRPCYSVGGDVYNFFQLGQDRLGIALADVSGKGIPAAMITSSLNAFWKALCEPPFDLAAFCFRVNNLLTGIIPAATFATMIFIEIDLERGLIHYCNCGHNPGLLLSDNQFARLDNTGLMLGMFPNYHFQVKSVPFQPGDLLLIYTDGLSEASIKFEDDIEEFGLERIMNIMRENHSPKKILETLNSAVNIFTGKDDMDDDLTMIAVRFNEIP